MAALQIKRKSSPTSATATRDRKAVGEYIQGKFVAARRIMQEGMIQRDDEIDLVLVAIICGEHPLLVGPPGTGKSFLLDTLLRLFPGCTKFSYLIQKFSTPEEIFGPFDVAAMKASRYVRVTRGKLPEANFAMLDELFKGSPAILNTTLRVLNERNIEDGDGGFRTCPLVSCFAGSNEWPDLGELGALFDRFLLRKKVRKVQGQADRQRLRRLPRGFQIFFGAITGALYVRREKEAMEAEAERESTKVGLKIEAAGVADCTMNLEELARAQEDAMALPVSDAAWEALDRIVDVELPKEGIDVGDRRMRKSMDVARAYAYLLGADEVLPEHLEILAHVLWEDPAEQPEKAAAAVARVANPVAVEITAQINAAHEVMGKTDMKDSRQATRANEVMHQIIERLEVLKVCDRRDRAIKYVRDRMHDLHLASYPEARKAGK
jgi:MoxR-like ATPase